MKKDRGLTLIELAIVLIVLGILLGIGAGIIGVLIKRVKYNESKEIVNAAVEGIIGYAIATGKLPDHDCADNNCWEKVVRSKNDSYGKPLAYVYDSNLTSNGAICSLSSTFITVSSPAQTVNNVAFVVVSGDGNYNNQTHETGAINSETTINVYEYGTEVNGEPYDDIVKWVSLYELKTKVNCPGVGSGGICPYGSSITVKNVGDARRVKIGTVDSSNNCKTSGGCGDFKLISIDVGECFKVYSGSGCSEEEKTYTYDDAHNTDSNGDCMVNYNNKSLQDN